MGVNFKQLKQLKNKLENVEKNLLTSTIDNVVVSIADEFLKEVIERTPKSNNDELKNNWKKRVSVRNSTYFIEIYNDIEYSSFIEYGHKVDDGFKEGYFMLTLTESYIKNNIDKISKPFLDNLFRGVFR